MRVKMLRTRNYTPRAERRVTTKFLARQEYTVRREWGEEMVADGDAEEAAVPPRDPLDHDGDGRKGGARKPAETAE